MRRRFELRIENAPPCASDRRMVRRTSSRPLRPWRRRWASRVASLRASGPTRPLDVGQLLACGVHQIDVLDERRAQRSRHGLGATVGDETSDDLAPHLGTQQVDQAVGCPLQRAVRASGSAVGVGRFAAAESRRSFGVETMHHPVEVVAPADRPARLEPGQPVDGTATRPRRASRSSPARSAGSDRLEQLPRPRRPRRLLPHRRPLRLAADRLGPDWIVSSSAERDGRDRRTRRTPSRRRRCGGRS